MSRNCSESLTNKHAGVGINTYKFNDFIEENNLLYCLMCNIIKKKKISDFHYSWSNLCQRPCYTPAETTMYKCGPCKMTINGLNHWKFHHMDTAHRTLCHHYVGRLYSAVSECHQIVFYDTKERILDNLKLRKSSEDWLKLTTNIMEFMAYVYSIHEASQFKNCKDTIYYCYKSYSEEKSLPLLYHRLYSMKFYCPFCRVVFRGGYRIYKMHLMSVEHGVLFERATRRAYDEECQGWTVPRIVRRGFDGLLAVSQKQAPICTLCKLCGVNVATARVFEHLKSCTGVQPSNRHVTWPNLYRYFRCGACYVWLQGVKRWSLHVQNRTHYALCCGELSRYVYYECVECHDLYYIDGVHNRPEFCKHPLKPLDLTYLMRYVFYEMNKAIVDDDPEPKIRFYYLEKNGNFGRYVRSDEPNICAPHYCHSCRLDFYGDVAKFQQHAATIEHLLLRFLAPVSAENVHVDDRNADDVEDDEEEDYDTELKYVEDDEEEDYDTELKYVEDDEEEDDDDAYARKLASRLKTVGDPSIKTKIKSIVDAVFDLNVR